MVTLIFLRFAVLFSGNLIINFYTTFTNFSTKYPVMCKVYTNVGGIK